jgi:hypothetical protein
VDSFGSRQLLFDMFNQSDLQTNKVSLVGAYDPAPATALARCLAGIDERKEQADGDHDAAG